MRALVNYHTIEISSSHKSCCLVVVFVPACCATRKGTRVSGISVISYIFSVFFYYQLKVQPISSKIPVHFEVSDLNCASLLG